MLGCMIAGTSTGCGKTTVALGIMAALKDTGYSVLPYKTGPDYIDTGFHTMITGRSSTNLDSWLCDRETVRYLYARDLENADIGIVEGAMGLFDGSGAKNSLHSGAHIAKILDIPVILVLDGSGLSFTAAAIVRGFARFDRKVKIAGVIVNRAASDAHFALLKQAIEEKAGVPCLGYLPDHTAFSLRERHLGLVPACEAGGFDTAALSQAVQRHIDLNRLISLCAPVQKAPLPQKAERFLTRYGDAYTGRRIGIAKDRAFHFYYQPNLDLLQLAGAQIIPFSPLADSALPDVDMLYLGGGFPEMFAQELCANTAMRESIQQKLEAGMPCYAECGGMMYLCETLQTGGGAYPMVGFFPAGTVFTQSLQNFGYAKLKLGTGETLNIHEFHYSRLEAREPLSPAYTVIRNGGSFAEGMKKKRTLAGYQHLHFWNNPKALLRLLPPDL